MKLLIFITTYNRPEMCLNLLFDIKAQQGNYDIEIVVVNDCSNYNYKPVRQFLKANFKHHYISNSKNLGKKFFWMTVNKGFEIAEATTWDHFFMLGDDLQITSGFFDKAIELFNSRPAIICLNLLTEYSRSMTKMWTNVEPVVADKNLIVTGWMDMCFMAGKRFFDLIEYKLNPVDPAWSGDPTKSSGVGMQISRRIVAKGERFHQVRQSLVIHGDHHSQMHPQERLINPLITNHNPGTDTKTASLAAVPKREKQLRIVINSLLPQVDIINVYLNNWKKVPDFLKHPKIAVYRSQDEAGDLGDAGKFYRCEHVKGYHFTVDDDIFYPDNYISNLVKAIERYGRKCAVSYHGRAFDNFPVMSYYSGAAMTISCLQQSHIDQKAHVVGTGVLGYHTDTVKIKIADFKAPNMADIWFSIQCENQNVGRIILAHDEDYIKDQHIPFSETIAGWHHNSESVQVAAMNSINWKSLKIEPNMNGLRPDVALKYYVDIIKPGNYNFKDFGDIDLCNITMEQADSLVERGFSFLKLKRQNIIIPNYKMPAIARPPDEAIKQNLMMNIIAVMPIRERLPLLRVTIERLLRRNGVTQVICIGDSMEEEKVVNDSGGIFVKYKNNPLSEKCNIGFNIAKDFNPDGVLFTGSSDWLSDNWIAEVGKYLNEYDMVGKLDYYMLDIGQNYRACHWLGYPKGERYHEPIGIGRIISARYLAKVKWNPLEPWKNSSLDASLFKLLNKNNGKTKIVEDGNLLSLSISTDRWHNLHKFDKHWENKEPGQTNRISMQLIDQHFPEYKTIFTHENMQKMFV